MEFNFLLAFRSKRKGTERHTRHSLSQDPERRWFHFLSRERRLTITQIQNVSHHVPVTQRSKKAKRIPDVKDETKACPKQIWEGPEEVVSKKVGRHPTVSAGGTPMTLHGVGIPATSSVTLYLLKYEYHWIEPFVLRSRFGMYLILLKYVSFYI
jgi:hypothetical protein